MVKQVWQPRQVRQREILIGFDQSNQSAVQVISK